ncbi:PREDICTED: uncharacterized protein LOC109126581 [Camelina sativa]|uniref:Uncharacterized protein LOC109126581 n=1 Tax=Camelina sativa TaxID=90675 RepID=A0ABM1QGC8_CAMSA|nr:PREDICTED: uncharacterized protein LOC109126581 [Camelina sativa]
MATTYPFPDNVHVSSSVTLKLTDSNYLLWKTQFESLLSSQKLIGFINGAVTAPSKSRLVVNGDVTTEVPNPQYEAWLCTDHKHIDESMKIFGFLNGLGREYDPITTVIQNYLSKLPTPTFNDVISEVQGFDTKLQSYDDSPSANPHLAFMTEKTNPCASQYQPNSRGRGGRFSQNRVRGGYSTRGRGFSQHQSSSTTQGERPICQICGRTGYTAIKCYNHFDNNYQSEVPSQAFAYLRVSDENGREWHLDSAATAHITTLTSGLQDATSYKGTDAVMVGDGAYLPITHIGSTTISSAKGTIPLNEVLVCPDMQKNLLSVSKLCDDYSCGVFFDSDFVYIIDLTTQKVVSKGPRKKGLYVLQNQEFVAFYSNRQCAATLDTWHHRLGHSNSRILQHLRACKEIEVNKSRTSPICEPCQMRKSNKLQFFSSDSRDLQPLERVHCDLWGPSPVVSNKGFKYYAVFVDDHSRYSWFFPL